MKNHFKEIERTLQGAGRILLASHENPDGDGLGSMLAFSYYLDVQQIPHTCFSTHPIPRMYHFLPGITRFTVGEDTIALSDHDVVVFFDIGDVKRSRFADRLRQQKEKTKVINIDHHPTKMDVDGVNVVDIAVIDTAASATTQMVHQYFELVGHTLNQAAATCLMTGLATDTGNFSNLGTTEESMWLGSKLLLSGARFNRITLQTLKSKPLADLKLWGRALERLKEDPKTKMVTTALFLKDLEECGVNEDAAEGISNFLNELEGGKIICVFREKEGGEVKASMRTTAPDGDVRSIAERFGGGGHMKAAGYTVKGTLVKGENAWEIQQDKKPLI
ncbi:MAG: bifunctional oligoribonuclease/PAP phosphatase NrnA [Patescibacteria group bacterium]|jgi:phosphoesterase RecJ-like protein